MTTEKVYNSLTCKDCPKFRRLTCLAACREMNEVFDKLDQGMTSDFRLRVFDKDYKEIDTIENQPASTLLEMGKTLQKTFDCYYRLEYIDRRGSV